MTKQLRIGARIGPTRPDSRGGSVAQLAQTNAARTPDASPTLFVLLHLEGSADDDTTVRVGRAISNPGGQLGGALGTEIIGYRARWA